MMERPEDLLLGAEIVRQKLGAEETIIGVELNKPDAIEILRQHIQPEQPVRVVPLKVKYPQGAEKMIIKTVFGKEVPAGQLPRDVEVNVNNVGTIVAIADYFLRGLPSIERILTVAGPGVSYPANLIVPLGTPVREVLRFCGGLKEETRECNHGGSHDGPAHRKSRCSCLERKFRDSSLHRCGNGTAERVSLHPLWPMPGGMSLFPQSCPLCPAGQSTDV